MRALTCDRCGAPASPTRAACVYCGAATTAEEDLIVGSSFGDGGGWVLTREVRPDLVVDATSRGRLRVCLGDKHAHPDLVVPVAWLGRSFVDLSVSATMRFSSPRCDAAAGFWLRAGDGLALVVLAWDDGRVTVSTNREQRHHRMLSTVAPSADHDPLRGTRLTVSLIGTKMTVTRDQRPIGSFVVDHLSSGEAELRVQPGDGAVEVVFSDALARAR